MTTATHNILGRIGERPQFSIILHELRMKKCVLSLQGAIKRLMLPGKYRLACVNDAAGW